MTPEEELRRGGQARQILGNEIYQEAYQAIRERIWQQLSLAETDAEKRARLNALAISLESVRKYLENVMTGGKMAAEQIERDRTLAERVKSRLGV